MRRMILVMIFLVLGTLSMADKVAYVMVPESGNYSDLRIIGVDEYEGRYHDSDITKGKKIDIDIKDYYGETELLKLSIPTDKDIKIVVTYKVGDNKYINLGSGDISDEVIEELQDRYDDEIESLDIIDYSNYDEFPGYEVKENVILVGTKVGTEKISKDGRTDPSNIVEKFEKNSEDEPIEGKIRINPGNGKFELTDMSGTKFVAADFKEFLRQTSGDYVFLEGPVNALKFKTIGGTHTVEIDGNTQSFKGNYIYGNLDWVVVVNTNGSGNGHWYVSLSEKEGSNVVHPDEVYVIASEGLQYEGNVKMTSGEGQKRSRISDINIGVLEGGESRFEIKSIKE